MQKTNWLALIILVAGGVVGCNSGGGITSSSWVNPNPNPVESPIVPPAVSQWTTMVGESFALANDWAPPDELSYDAQNNVIVGAYYSYPLNDISEYYLNQGYSSDWQDGIAAQIFHWGMGSTSNITTNNDGMFYFFAEGPDLLQPIPRYLLSFNDKTMTLHYQEIIGAYPADTDFSQIYYYNGSVYAVESALRTNAAYNYNLVSFSVESNNFGTYESTLNDIYSSNSMWYTATTWKYMGTHSNSEVGYNRFSVISATIGDNGNLYVNDDGQVKEISLSNPANIRNIGVQLGDNYDNITVGYATILPYTAPIAYNNGRIYSCGQPSNDYRVNEIISLPINSAATTPWQSIGYTWYWSGGELPNGNIEHYSGCSRITSNGNKIFVFGEYETAVRGVRTSVGAVYESDISTTFNTNVE